MGDVERLRYEKEAEARATTAERQRCAEIVQMARDDEVDRDWRTIIDMIEAGYSIEQIKRLYGSAVLTQDKRDV
jgi:hypothetical protein